MLWRPPLIYSQSQLSTDVRPADATGATVTPAVGSKGSYVSLMTMTRGCYGLHIVVHTNNTSTASRETVIDIGADTSGGTSYTVVIPDLLCGNATFYLSGGTGINYYFPIFLPAGTQIAVRAQGSVTTTFRVIAYSNAQPNNCITKVTAIGLGTLPAGTAVTPGTTSEGTWTSLGTTSTVLRYWQLGVAIAASDTSHQSALLHCDLAWGDATNKRLIFQNIRYRTTSTEDHAKIANQHEGWCHAPSGTTIYARAQTSGVVDTTQMTAYGGA
jgi:hypothetical protein